MKLRRGGVQLLLLSVSVVSALSDAAQDTTRSTVAKVGGRDAAALVEPALDGSKGKYDVGTKDAPVDGKDGKPHAGPWVGTDPDKKSKSGSDTTDADSSVKAGKKDDSELIGADGTRIPQANDGVMDDPNRQAPKQGTTGTEGGVSEKDKARKAQEGQTGEKVGKTPDPPKEARPLPLSETKNVGEKNLPEGGKAKAKDEEEGDDDTAEGLAGLEKPDDLPDKLSNEPHPVPGSAKKDHLDVSKSKSTSKSGAKVDLTDDVDAEGLIQPLHSYLLSLTMILFSEVGDKTFLIAALMAMKHDRLLVFSAAFSALIAMTILSAVLGHAVPTLIPKRFTNFLAAGLFLVFGTRMLREGLAMSPGEGVGAEMQEVEMELEEKEALAREQGRRRSSVSPYALEMGMGGGRASSRKTRPASRLPSPPRSPSSSPEGVRSPPRSNVQSALGGLNNLLTLLLSPAWVQTFVMTFLGEWGDRSQIATIAMAAGQDYWWVTGGAVSGHAVCTGVAVIGGRAIAGKVSLRVVTLGGAGAFLIFGVIYLAEALYYA